MDLLRSSRPNPSDDAIKEQVEGNRNGSTSGWGWSKVSKSVPSFSSPLYGGSRTPSSPSPHEDLSLASCRDLLTTRISLECLFAPADFKDRYRGEWLRRFDRSVCVDFKDQFKGG